jgi:hypothetical protein
MNRTRFVAGILLAGAARRGAVPGRDLADAAIVAGLLPEVAAQTLSQGEAQCC